MAPVPVWTLCVGLLHQHSYQSCKWCKCTLEIFPRLFTLWDSFGGLQKRKSQMKMLALKRTNTLKTWTEIRLKYVEFAKQNDTKNVQSRSSLWFLKESALWIPASSALVYGWLPQCILLAGNQWKSRNMKLLCCTCLRRLTNCVWTCRVDMLHPSSQILLFWEIIFCVSRADASRKHHMNDSLYGNKTKKSESNRYM